MFLFPSPTGYLSFSIKTTTALPCRFKADIAYLVATESIYIILHSKMIYDHSTVLLKYNVNPRFRLYSYQYNLKDPTEISGALFSAHYACLKRDACKKK